MTEKGVKGDKEEDDEEDDEEKYSVPSTLLSKNVNEEKWLKF